MRILLLGLLLLGAAPAGYSQTAPAATVTVPAGVPVALATTAELNSKKALKGDQVALTVTENLFIDGVLVIPKGSTGKAVVSFAQDTGAFGQSGKLKIEPLYVEVGSEIIRLTGILDKKGSVTAGAAVGLAVLTPGMTGRSAKLPAGTTIPAAVLFEKSIKAPPQPTAPGQ